MFDGDAFWSCYHFRDGGRAVKDLLVKTFPDDPTLAASRVCTEPIASPVPDSPPDFVFVDEVPEVVSQVPPK